jgi:hypothetical protein
MPLRSVRLQPIAQSMIHTSLSAVATGLISDFLWD